MHIKKTDETRMDIRANGTQDGRTNTQLTKRAAQQTDMKKHIKTRQLTDRQHNNKTERQTNTQPHRHTNGNDKRAQEDSHTTIKTNGLPNKQINTVQLRQTNIRT